MAGFAYAPEVLARFPTIVGGVIHASGLTNGPSPAALRESFGAEQAAVLERLGGTPLSEVPSLAAWRRAFRGFGVDPTAYRSAAEAFRSAGTGHMAEELAAAVDRLEKLTAL